jgi:hypothetical protein
MRNPYGNRAASTLSAFDRGVRAHQPNAKPVPRFASRGETSSGRASMLAMMATAPWPCSELRLEAPILLALCYTLYGDLPTGRQHLPASDTAKTVRRAPTVCSDSFYWRCVRQASGPLWEAAPPAARGWPYGSATISSMAALAESMSGCASSAVSRPLLTMASIWLMNAPSFLYGHGVQHIQQPADVISVAVGGYHEVDIADTLLLEVGYDRRAGLRFAAVTPTVRASR